VNGFDVSRAVDRLRAAGGGYEVVSATPGMELGVYVPPAPDPQQPHDADEAYVVLEGEAVLEAGDERLELRPGGGAFVPAGEPHRFVGYDAGELVVLVVFQR
jgi:mannose-6-phosphate isomerase-like protein (cupin superfamily)